MAPSPDEKNRQQRKKKSGSGCGASAAVLVAVIAVLRLINSLRGYFSGFSIPAGGSARKISDAASSAGNAVVSQYPSGLIIRICLIVIAAEAVILAVVIICGIAAGRKKDPPDTPQSSISSATGQ